MLFESILGLSHIKNHLISSTKAGRISHAQLFVGPEGCGTLPMAIAYAQYILCESSDEKDEQAKHACNLKCNSLTHPDLHFAYPVANSNKAKSHAVSDHYIEDFRAFVKEQPYGNLFDWYRLIDIEKKQGQIGVDEAQEIVKKLALKSYEGGYKICVIWMADKMNTSASNKLLKLIEEPPAKTVFILIAEDAIANGLINQGITKEQALRIAHEANGNYNKALDLMNNDSEDLIFERWFVQWVRSAFKAKGNKAAIHDLILWSAELAKTGRETQKNFLLYCIAIMRQAMLINYNVQELAYMRIHIDGFDIKKFAPFVHENNIIEITEELERAIYHIERNGNAKLIFTDLSIRLTRLLHKKPIVA
jgi:DNA polymerase-3 subunit delta'